MSIETQPQARSSIRPPTPSPVRSPSAVWQWRYPLRVFAGFALAGGMVLTAGLVFAPDRVWSNLLVATFYLLTLALGGTLFLALTAVCGGAWQVAFSRIPQAMARVTPIAGLAILAVLAWRMTHYGWHPHGGGDAGTFWFKELWLTPWFWMSRSVVYVVLWSLLAVWLSAGASRRLGVSALFLVVYTITFSLAAIDWLMALQPMWFSTMWGVYQFAGTMQATLAVIVLLGLALRTPDGPLRGIFTDEHLHDLGKLLLGFSCFWMYIWFCQYMLIWYANLPEETSYFIVRTTGAWAPLTVACVALNWIVPFFLLLPRAAKRSGAIMAKAAVVLLVGRWLDLYVIVFPSTIGDAPVLGAWEIAAIACLIGTAGILLLRSLASSDATPLDDPRWSTSIHYHAG